MKITAMIPARMGSKRVKNKNLRLINGKPLIQYVLDTVKNLTIFDEIYINSEHDIFSELAEENNIKFYKRPDHLSSDSATNDEFAFDFLKNVNTDILIQILPTSPFLSAKEITDFVSTMISNQFDTLISVENKQIACVYEGNPINFDRFAKNPPSQTMTPISAYATALMGWKSKKFIENMNEYGVAYHGGNGKIGYFELRGLSTIDIDREEDFQLAEAIIVSQLSSRHGTPQYYCGKKSVREEVDVHSILTKDGITNNDLFDSNKEVVNINEILNDMSSNISWSKRIIDTENNSMTVIAQMPGEGNRRHHHPDWHEWWYIVEGEWDWEIEGEHKTIKQGDIVYMQKNRIHKITAAGNKRAVRMAISRSDVVHVYEE